jgi:hypothetical protein
LSNASPEVKREALRLLLDFLNETKPESSSRPAPRAMGQGGMSPLRQPERD